MLSAQVSKKTFDLKCHLIAYVSLCHSQEGIAYYNSVLDELENAGVFKRVVVEVIVWWCS